MSQASTETANSWLTPAAEAAAPSGWWPWMDRLGAGLSFTCAMHCLALPLLLLAMPVLQTTLGVTETASHGWLQWLVWSHEVEWIFSATVLLFAGLVLGRGYRVHRATVALRRFAAGALVLLFTVAEWIDGGQAHGLFLAIGGSLVAWAHWTNLRLLAGRHC